VCPASFPRPSESAQRRAGKRKHVILAMPDFLPDILAPNLLVVFCGINPGVSAAQSGHHFVNRSNRFWRVLDISGFTPHQIAPENDRSILAYGYGLTTAVPRPTRRAAELSRKEFASARGPRRENPHARTLRHRVSRQAGLRRDCRSQGSSMGLAAGAVCRCQSMGAAKSKRVEPRFRHRCLGRRLPRHAHVNRRRPRCHRLLTEPR
jgi:G:T/U-mismatch repair DNA glycosylase